MANKKLRSYGIVLDMSSFFYHLIFMTNVPSSGKSGNTLWPDHIEFHSKIQNHLFLFSR
jgi:hypothetical protein